MRLDNPFAPGQTMYSDTNGGGVVGGFLGDADPVHKAAGFLDQQNILARNRASAAQTAKLASLTGQARIDYLRSLDPQANKSAKTPYGIATKPPDPWSDTVYNGDFGHYDGRGATPSWVGTGAPAPQPTNNGALPPPGSDGAINPYAAGAAQDTQAANTGIQGAQSNISSLQGQQAAVTGAPTGYPAMPNSYGLGQAPTAQAAPGAASNPSYGASPITINTPDTSSRGFNPWSMTGESVARGK